MPVLPHTCRSLSRRRNAPASQLQRRQDQLDSNDVGLTPKPMPPTHSQQQPASGRQFTGHIVNEAAQSQDFVRSGTLEDDGLRHTRQGLMTECLVAEPLERVSGGVSVYSIHGNELENVTQPSVHQLEALSECSRRSVGTSPSDEDPAPSSVAVQLTTTSTVHARCEVLQLAEQENDTTKTSTGSSELHKALQSKCTKLLDTDCTYSGIENQLLPRGMCHNVCICLI